MAKPTQYWQWRNDNVRWRKFKESVTEISKYPNNLDLQKPETHRTLKIPATPNFFVAYGSDVPTPTREVVDQAADIHFGIEEADLPGHRDFLGIRTKFWWVYWLGIEKFEKNYIN